MSDTNNFPSHKDKIYATASKSQVPSAGINKYKLTNKKKKTILKY